MQVVGNNQCRCSYQELTDNMMCAGVAEGGKDACQVRGVGVAVRAGPRGVEPARCDGTCPSRGTQAVRW